MLAFATIRLPTSRLTVRHDVDPFLAFGLLLRIENINVNTNEISSDQNKPAKHDDNDN